MVNTEENIVPQTSYVTSNPLSYFKHGEGWLCKVEFHRTSDTVSVRFYEDEEYVFSGYEAYTLFSRKIIELEAVTTDQLISWGFTKTTIDRKLH